MSLSIKNAGSVSCQEPVRHCRSQRGGGCAAGREASGLEKPDVYSMEYIGNFWAEPDADGRGTVNAGQAPKTSN
jgi:hypothetical protein